MNEASNATRLEAIANSLEGIAIRFMLAVSDQPGDFG